MKSFRRLLILTSIFFSVSITVKASHLIGGEIRWECLSDGKYIFYMDIYRECNGTTFSFTTQSLRILNSTMPGISMKPDQATFALYNAGKISPKGPSGCQKACVNGGPGSNPGAIQFFPFVSDPVTLTGTPPSSGWVFYWEGYARPHTVENLDNSGSQGFGLRAAMYPYKGENVDSCFDSSPEFYELPGSSVAIGSKYSLSMAAKDADADSLMHYFDDPLNASASGNTFSPNPVAWAKGYNKDSPFPNTFQHFQNIPAQLDSLTGHLTGRIVSPGMPGWSFAYSIRVDAYREGVKIASVWRDVPLLLHEAANANYLAPSFRFNGIVSNNYHMEVEAGQSIQLPIQVLDSNFLPDTNNPGVIRARDIALMYSGKLFSRDLSNENNCLDSAYSCATITPAPEYDSIVYNDFISKDSANINLNFNWNTSCELLGEENSKNYIFLFKSIDDQCPPEVSYASLRIELHRYHPEIIQNANVLTVDAGSDSYQWFYNDTLIPNSDTNSIQMQASGKYSVEVVRNGCTSVRGSSILYAVGIGERAWESQLLIYPNPFNSSFTIEFPGKLNESTVLVLSDINGKKIPVHPKFHGNTIVLNGISSLPKGMYFLSILVGDQQLYKKLIKY